MNAPVGYLELLKRRPAYRAIWLGAVVSLIGDWFTLLALYGLLNEYTGSGEAIGLLLVARFLPAGLFSPLAGAVADRMPRRTIMISCDVVRGLTVLGFLLVRSKADVPLVYLLAFVQMAMSAFFDPAEQAAIGSVVERDEIVTATTLHAITWSATLSVGAVLGGLVTELLGRQSAFALDALSYALSAFFLWGAVIPLVQHEASEQSLFKRSLTDLAEGLALASSNPRVRRVLWVKTGWALCGGGAFVLYAVLGEHEFKLGTSGTASIGVLLGTRGLGALLGPLLARRIGGDGQVWLQRAITIAFCVTLVFWLLFSMAPWLPLAALALCAAHMGISTQWVFSSSLLTLLVPDRLRGRIFSIDFMLYTLVFAASSWLTGWALDRFGVAPRHLMSALAMLLVVPIGVWLALGRLQSASGPENTPSQSAGGGVAS